VSYRVELSPSAQRQLKKMPRGIQQVLAASIDSLAIASRPNGAIKLKGEDNAYRI